jgi:hypothetical protein
MDRRKIRSQIIDVITGQWNPAIASILPTMLAFSAVRSPAGIQDGLAAHLVDLVASQVNPADPEAGHVPGAGSPDIPVAGYHRGVLLTEHRVEDRLARQPGRPSPPSRSFNQRKFFGTNWPPQRHSLGFFGHALNDQPSWQRARTDSPPVAEGFPMIIARLVPFCPEWKYSSAASG